MLGKVMVGLFGAAVGAEIVKDAVREASSDRIYVVPSPQPQYQQGGRPTQRGYYSTAPQPRRHVIHIHQETLDVLDDMKHACNFKAHSVGREIAYQIHNGCESGWHGCYPCSSLARRELARLASEADVYDVMPHDGDAAYLRLYRGILAVISTSCEIIW